MIVPRVTNVEILMTYPTQVVIIGGVHIVNLKSTQKAIEYNISVTAANHQHEIAEMINADPAVRAITAQDMEIGSPIAILVGATMT